MPPSAPKRSGDPASLAGGSSCDDLEPVTPRVGDVEASLTRDLGVVGPRDVDACGGERRGKLSQCLLRADERAPDGPSRGGERVVDTDVQLRAPARNQQPPRTREERRLLELRQPEQSAVEGAGGGFAARGRGDLNVVEPDDAPGRSSQGRTAVVLGLWLRRDDDEV